MISMKITKTIEIKFPWRLEGDSHGSTYIHDEGNGKYRYLNKFSDGRICQDVIKTQDEVFELINDCYEITRVER